jgi:hypothetical protein
VHGVWVREGSWWWHRTAALLEPRGCPASHRSKQAPRARCPSTYLVCAQDNGHLGALQREFARGAGRVVELVAAHHPFLSQPADVRDLMPTL